MSGTYLKMLMDVKLVGDISVSFHLMYLNRYINEWSSPILFISDDNYIIEKSNIFKYTTSRLILPYKLGNGENYKIQYDFNSENERYERLKKLYFNLIKFSNSKVFVQNSNVGSLSNTLNLTEQKWFLY